MYSFEGTLIVLAAVYSVAAKTQWKDVLEFRSRTPGRCDNNSPMVYFDCGTVDLKCIPLVQFHDGKPDCPNESDEYCFKGYVKCGPYCVLETDVKDYCTHPTQQKLCPVSDSIPCKGYGECVLISWLLNGEKDCLDGSDEDPAYASGFLGTNTSLSNGGKSNDDPPAAPELSDPASASESPSTATNPSTGGSASSVPTDASQSMDPSTNPSTGESGNTTSASNIPGTATNPSTGGSGSKDPTSASDIPGTAKNPSTDGSGSKDPTSASDVPGTAKNPSTDGSGSKDPTSASDIPGTPTNPPTDGPGSKDPTSASDISGTATNPSTVESDTNDPTSASDIPGTPTNPPTGGISSKDPTSPSDLPGTATNPPTVGSDTKDPTSASDITGTATNPSTGGSGSKYPTSSSEFPSTPTSPPSDGSSSKDPTSPSDIPGTATNPSTGGSGSKDPTSASDLPGTATNPPTGGPGSKDPTSASNIPGTASNPSTGGIGTKDPTSASDIPGTATSPSTGGSGNSGNDASSSYLFLSNPHLLDPTQGSQTTGPTPNPSTDPTSASDIPGTPTSPPSDGSSSKDPTSESELPGTANTMPASASHSGQGSSIVSAMMTTQDGSVTVPVTTDGSGTVGPGDFCYDGALGAAKSNFGGSSICPCLERHFMDSNGKCIPATVRSVQFDAIRLCGRELTFFQELNDPTSPEFQNYALLLANSIAEALVSAGLYSAIPSVCVPKLAMKPGSGVLITVNLQCVNNSDSCSGPSIESAFRHQDSFYSVRFGPNVVDINECSDESLNDCHENAICEVKGFAYTCMCADGYRDISLAGYPGRWCTKDPTSASDIPGTATNHPTSGSGTKDPTFASDIPGTVTSRLTGGTSSNDVTSSSEFPSTSTHPATVETVGPGDKCYDDALVAAKSRFGSSSVCPCLEGHVMDSNGRCIPATVGSVQFRALQLCGRELTFSQELNDPTSPDYQNYALLSANAIYEALNSAGLSAAMPSICVPKLAMTPGNSGVLITVNLQCANNSYRCSAASIESALERLAFGASVRFDPNVVDINECSDESLNDCHKNAICEVKGFAYTCMCTDGYRDISLTGYPGRWCSSSVETGKYNSFSSCTNISFFGMCVSLPLLIAAAVAIIALITLIPFLLWRCCCSKRSSRTVQVAPSSDPQVVQVVQVVSPNESRDTQYAICNPPVAVFLFLNGPLNLSALRQALAKIHISIIHISIYQKLYDSTATILSTYPCQFGSDSSSACKSEHADCGTGNLCQCRDGFVGDGGSCIEDGCLNATCHTNATCAAFFWYDARVELRASFRCVCHDGWIGDGLTCRPNPCAPGRNNCHQQAVCMIDLDGIEFSCFCKEGLMGNGTSCYPDPCLTSTDTCSLNAVCQPLYLDSGSLTREFTCQCKNSYYGDGFTCTPDPCFQSPKPCHVNAWCTPNPAEDDSFSCMCVYPFEGNGTFCQLIGNATCAADQYTCPKTLRCIPYAWTLDGIKDCSEGEDESESLVDECLAGKHRCHPFAECANIPNGAYECHCREPFFGDGSHCDNLLPVTTSTTTDMGFVNITTASTLELTTNFVDCNSSGQLLRCKSTPVVCISALNILNGVDDCPEGDDEKNEAVANIAECDQQVGQLSCDPRANCSLHMNGLCYCVSNNNPSDARLCRSPTNIAQPTSSFPPHWISERVLPLAYPIMYSFEGTLIVLAAVFSVATNTLWKDVLEFRSRTPGRCDNTSPVVYFDCGGADLKCIPLVQFHDGNPDCPDGSDEYCFKGYVKCGPYCVLETDVKDYCTHPTQEKLCPRSDSIPCKGYGECVLIKWLLNGEKDCLDGSDEDPTYASQFLGTTTTNPSTNGNGNTGNGNNGNGTTGNGNGNGTGGSTTTVAGGNGGTGSGGSTTTAPGFTTTMPSSSSSFSSTTTTASNEGGSSISTTTTTPEGGIVTVPVIPDGSGNVGPGDKCYDDALAVAKSKFGSTPICPCLEGEVMDSNGKCIPATVGSVQFRALQLCGKDLTFFQKLDDPASADFQNYAFLLANAISEALKSAGLSAAIPSICVPKLAMKPGSVLINVNLQCVNNSDSCTIASIKSALERQATDASVRFDPNVVDINECSDESLNDCHENAICEIKGFAYTCMCADGFNDTGAAGYPGRQCTSSVAQAGSTCTKVSFLGMCLPLLLFIIAILVLIALLLFLLFLLWRCCCSNRSSETEQVAPLGDPQDAQDVWSNGSKKSGNSIDARKSPAVAGATDLRVAEEGGIAETNESVQTVQNASIFPSLLKSGAQMDGPARMEGIKEIDSILSMDLDAEPQQVQAVIEDRPESKRSGGTPTIWETYRKLGQQYARFSSSKTRKSTPSSLHSAVPVGVGSRGMTAQDARELTRLNLTLAGLNKIAEERPEVGDASVTELINGNSQLPVDPTVLAAAVKKVRDGRNGSSGSHDSQEPLNPDGSDPYEQWKQRAGAEPSTSTADVERPTLDAEDVDLTDILPKQIDEDIHDTDLPHHPNAPVYREARQQTPDSETSSKRESRAASRAGDYGNGRPRSRNSGPSGAPSATQADNGGGRPRSRASGAYGAPNAMQADNGGGRPKSRNSIGSAAPSATQEDNSGAPFKENLWWGHQ
uniref:EGF-like domain-containing protein n=1 Tax=Plectus sambesii TaxID=2011161 RepID=A0A914WHY5_9BILA